MTTQFLGHDGGQIAYDVTGSADAPLVVCAPGMGDVRAVYRFLVPQLVDAGYRVATMDLRGHGESSVGWDDHASATQGGELLALVRHLGGPAVLVGDSLGAASAACAAADAPTEIRGIVLAGPAVRTPSMNLFARAAAAIVTRSARLWTMFYGSLYKSGKPADFDGYVRSLRSNLAEPGRLAAMRAMIAAGHDAAEVRLSDVQCPALILMGTADPDFPDPVAEARWIESRLTGSAVTVTLLDGCGHYPPAEQPDAAGAAILAFVKETHGA